MGGRRRKKRRVLKRVVKIPTVFQCPNCGSKNLTITFSKSNTPGRKNALVVCGQCGLRYEMTNIPEIYSTVDVYSKFIDLFDAGQIPVESIDLPPPETSEEELEEEAVGEEFEE